MYDPFIPSVKQCIVVLIIIVSDKILHVRTW